METIKKIQQVVTVPVPKLLAYLSIAISAISIGLNVWASEADFFSKFGACFLGLPILALILGLLVHFKGNLFAAILTAVIALLFLCAGGDLIAQVLLRKPSPLIKVEINNSVNLYPMPPEDDPGFPKWLEKKFLIGPGEGAQRVGIATLKVIITAAFIISWTVWLLEKLRIGGLEKAQGLINPVFLLLWLATAVWGFCSPINTPEMDSKTAEALELQWWLGFFQNLWWPLIIHTLGNVLWGLWRALKKGAGFFTRNRQLDILVSAFSLLVLQLITWVFNPTMISWTLCSHQLIRTGATASLCQAAFASGRVTAQALAKVWVWLYASLFKDA